MLGASSEVGRLEDVVTVGIKHTSNFARRRVMLDLLLRSVRERHGQSIPIVVADDGGSPTRLPPLTTLGEPARYGPNGSSPLG